MTDETSDETAEVDFPPEVKEVQDRLYAQVDALNTERRLLLVQSLLARVLDGFEHMAGAKDPVMASQASLLGGWVQVAGYAVAQEREDHDFTSTGDQRVNEVFDTLHALVQSAATSQMTQEEKDAADSIRKAVQARVQKGEPFEVVMRDELAKRRPDSPAEADEPNVTGLYL